MDAPVFSGMRCSSTGRCRTCSPSAWAPVSSGFDIEVFFIASGNTLVLNTGSTTDFKSQLKNLSFIFTFNFLAF
jgi:hypothetical protein